MEKSSELKLRKFIRNILKEEFIENNIDIMDSAKKMENIIEDAYYLRIEVPFNSEDAKLFTKVVGDTGFKKSIFDATPSNPNKKEN